MKSAKRGKKPDIKLTRQEIDDILSAIHVAKPTFEKSAKESGIARKHTCLASCEKIEKKLWKAVQGKGRIVYDAKEDE